MSALSQQLHQRSKAAKPEGPRVNPEIDAKLNKFIADNQGLYDAYMKMDKTLLARKLMLNRMKQSEAMGRKVDAMREVVDADPALKAKVDAAMAKIPPEKRESAYRNVAQSVLAQQAVTQRQAVGPKV